jgi:hypothetical protein
VRWWWRGGPYAFPLSLCVWRAAVVTCGGGGVGVSVLVVVVVLVLVRGGGSGAGWCMVVGAAAAVLGGPGRQRWGPGWRWGGGRPVFFCFIKISSPRARWASRRMSTERVPGCSRRRQLRRYSVRREQPLGEGFGERKGSFAERNPTLGEDLESGSVLLHCIACFDTIFPHNIPGAMSSYS